jgi:hypothetical protein
MQNARYLTSFNPLGRTIWYLPLSFARFARYQAFDADFDPEELSEAREWHTKFDMNSLPPGATSYSRSSGPGGQHVNKFVGIVTRSR